MKFIALTVVIVFASCKGGDKKSTAITNVGIDTRNIDSTVKPVDDFYQFVNGKWLKNNPVPATESRWGSFNELYDKNMDKLRKILDSAAANKNAKPGSNEQKIGDFFAVAMDSVKLNADGVAPLKEEFDAIEKIKTTDDVMLNVAHMQMNGFNPLLNGGVDQDAKKVLSTLHSFIRADLACLIVIIILKQMSVPRTFRSPI